MGAGGKRMMLLLRNFKLGFLLGPFLSCILWAIGTPFCIHW